MISSSISRRTGRGRLSNEQEGRIIVEMIALNLYLDHVVDHVVDLDTDLNLDLDHVLDLDIDLDLDLANIDLDQTF